MADGKLDILCVDDNAESRMIYSRICESLGHSVHVVENGIEAQQALMKKRYSLVLSDFMMEGLDGIELLLWMRSYKIETHFVLISAYHNASFETLSSIYSSCEFHPKPILPLAVKRIIQSVSERSPTAGEDLTTVVSERPLKQSAAEIHVKKSEHAGVPFRKDQHPFAAALLNELKIKLTGFESAVIYDMATRRVIDWATDRGGVTGEGFAEQSMRIVDHFIRMTGGKEIQDRMPMALSVLSSEHFQYFTPIEPTVVLHLVFRKDEINIGMLKLALFKVISQFIDINKR